MFRSRDLYVAFGAGLLALTGYIIDRGSPSPSVYGMVLALAAVAINGLPIIWGALKGLAARTVNVDELVSLAIVASAEQHCTHPLARAMLKAAHYAKVWAG